MTTETINLCEEALAHRADLLAVRMYLLVGGEKFTAAMRESRKWGELSVLRTAGERLDEMSEAELRDLHQATGERIEDLEAELDTELDDLVESRS